MGQMLGRSMEDRKLSCGFGGWGSIENLSRSNFDGGVGAVTRQERVEE